LNERKRKKSDSFTNFIYLLFVLLNKTKKFDKFILRKKLVINFIYIYTNAI